MKKFLAVIAGLLVAFVLISIGTLLSVKNFGALESVPTDLDSIKAMVGSLSTIGLVLVIVSHAIGSLAGGVTVGRILKDDTMNVGLTLGNALSKHLISNGVPVENIVQVAQQKQSIVLWWYFPMLEILKARMKTRNAKYQFLFFFCSHHFKCFGFLFCYQLGCFFGNGL